MYRRVGFMIDQDVFEEMKPLLKAEERTFSAWLRLSMSRYVRGRKDVAEGKTQIVGGRNGRI